ncbi:MAG: MATE family efflux transporter [Oscillospiraceae bacterium]|nr:MATE family efflux transporter [Oscillospiraceae bacterium]
MPKTSILRGNVRKQLITLAVPLLLGSLLQQLYNTADALIVGRYLGAEPFAAIGVSGTVMNLFIFALNGFCVGSGVLFGQLYGADDKPKFRRASFTALSSGACVTLVTSAVSICLMPLILKLLSTPAELRPHCAAYLTVILSGLICTYLYNLFSAMLRAIGDTKASLFFLLMSVLLNLILDFLLIAVLRLAIKAAAAATVASQTVSVICCVIYIMKKYPSLIFLKEDVGFHRDILSSIMKLGTVSALQQCSLYLGKLLVQGAVNPLGTAGIAAYTAATRIEGFASSFGDSCGQSMSIFISQNYGAGNLPRIREGMRKGMGLLAGMGIALSAIMFAFAGILIPIFLKETSPEILKQGCQYLHVVSIFYTLSFLGNGNVGFFRGTGKVLVPFACTTMHLALRVILSYIFVPVYGLGAVALATGIGWVLAVSAQSSIYFILWKKRAFDRPGAV